MGLPLPQYCPKTNVHRFPSERAFVAAVFKRIHDSFDANFAVDTAISATDGDFYIYGGTLRRVLLNDPRDGDLDIAIADGDTRIYDAYSRLGLGFARNSNNHHRYRWNKLQIDICSPCEFFSGYDGIDSMLQNVDLKLNSIALHVGSKRLIDPFGLVTSQFMHDVSVNWALWDKTEGDQLSLLVVRLVRILYEFPDLSVSDFDRNKLISNILPSIQQARWDRMIGRFPAGKETFLKIFLATIDLRKAHAPAHEEASTASQ